jgi:hypothetical protein
VESPDSEPGIDLSNFKFYLQSENESKLKMVNLLVFVHNFGQIFNLKVTIFGATTLYYVRANDITNYFQPINVKKVNGVLRRPFFVNCI